MPDENLAAKPITPAPAAPSKEPKLMPSAPGARIPPQALDLEQAVLGALITDDEAAIALDEFLQPEHFYHVWHQKIYAAIQTLVRRQQPVDLLTVQQELKDQAILDQVGGSTYLAQLTLNVASSFHVYDHAKIIVEKFLLRELIKASVTIQDEAYAYHEDTQEVLELAEQKVFEISQHTIRKQVQPLSVVMDKTVKEIKDAGQNTSSLSGISTGFPHIDEFTGGWQKGDLIIIAARPSVGKTAFVLTSAFNSTMQYGTRILFFSLEMPSQHLAMRLLSGETKIDQKQLRSGRLSDEQWAALTDAGLKLANAKIFFDDTHSIGPGEVRSKARKLKMTEQIDLIIIDYLQLMTSPTGNNKFSNREQEISRVSRALKALAKELDVPIIALSQLNRSMETRTDKIKLPKLSDLRESGAIEQDADIVAFIHRPEKLNVDTYPDRTPTTNMAEFRIEKNRNGETGTIFLSFAPSEVRFVDDQQQVDHYYNPNPGGSEEGEGNYVNSDWGAQQPMVTRSIPAGYAARVVASKAAGSTKSASPSNDLPPDMAEFSEELPEANTAQEAPF